MTVEGDFFLFEKGVTRAEKLALVALVGHDTIQQAADKIFISEKTLKYHKTKLYKKLGVKSTHGLFYRIRKYIVFEEDQPKVEPTTVCPVVSTFEKDYLPKGYDVESRHT